ncbi:hypothetical protein HY642_02125 [Candidatus Woesearchaeota archaeon]|nr:hypothetical protein [Candidatus Woesearchaeota archaeon]
MNFVGDWPELVGALVALAAIALAAAVYENVALILFSSLVAGAVFGRFWFRFKSRPKAPVFIVALGFLIGFLLGQLFRRGSVTFFVFSLGMIGSYYLHDRGIITSVEY